MDRQLALQENMEAQQELREPLSPIFGISWVCGCDLLVVFQRFQRLFPLCFASLIMRKNDTLGIISWLQRIGICDLSCFALGVRVVIPPASLTCHGYERGSI